jgi:hypothetical protein
VSVDLQKIRDNLPCIGETLASMLAKDGIGVLQDTEMALDDVGEIRVAIQMQTKDGDTIKFFMGMTTDMGDGEDDE